jgi:nucleotide-binding universal stress UspA family protein
MAQQLVLGYDGTEGAKAALEEAITLCQDLSAALIVVFGWQVTPERQIADLRDAIHEMGQQETAAAVSRAQEAGVTAEGRVEAERPAEALVSVAAEKDARMIVVGSHGDRPLKGILLGSTPHRLLHLSDTPVLVVRG